MGHSPSAQENTSLENSKKSYAAGNQALGDVSKSTSYFMGGDPSKTGLYRSLLTTGTDATNNAYNQAKAATRLHSNVSGFGYASPTGEASDTGIETARAGDLSKVPGQALQTAAGDELQAAGIEAGVGGSYLGNQSDNMKISNDAEMQRQKMNMAWLDALSSAAGSAATAYAGR